MRLTVLLFAAARDRAGSSTLQVEVSDTPTAREVLYACAAHKPELAPLLPQLRVAVNQVFVELDTPVVEGAEVALLPPVQGGSGPHLVLTSEPLSLERVVAAVSDEEHGAIATFSGVVRRTSHGKRVHRLDYEAYGAMADRTLRDLAAELVARYPSVRIAVEHRTGELAVGELAVVIAAGAPHRRDALSACEDAIEAVKARLPVWKREHTDEGAEWVGCEGCAPRAQIDTSGSQTNES
ncbi:MAG: molybdenum cofactor biosynthesis protein MoaE [Polyangia bacterium]